MLSSFEKKFLKNYINFVIFKFWKKFVKSHELHLEKKCFNLKN